MWNGFDNNVTVSAVNCSWETGKVTNLKKLEKKQRKKEKRGKIEIKSRMKRGMLLYILRTLGKL